VLADVVAERDLAGARDIPAVLDARLRSRTACLFPLPPGPWSGQVPPIADPGHRAYLTEIAALMDARKDRIGEHAAEHSLPWAISALGPVPADPADRRDWQQRASSIGAYRELSGYDHSADPIGPEPATAAPVGHGLLDGVARRAAHAGVQLGVHSLELVLDLSPGLPADFPAEPLSVRVKTERDHPAPAPRTGLVMSAVPAVRPVIEVDTVFAVAVPSQAT
jgi:hypothetical protein